MERGGGDSVSGWLEVIRRGLHTGGGSRVGGGGRAAHVVQAASLPSPHVWALGGVSGVSSEGGVVVLTMDLGGRAASGALVTWRWAAARVGQTAPLPTPHVGVMGRVSRISSEGGVPVLTMKLGGQVVSDALVT